MQIDQCFSLKRGELAEYQSGAVKKERVVTNTNLWSSLQSMKYSYQLTEPKKRKYLSVYR